MERTGEVKEKEVGNVFVDNVLKTSMSPRIPRKIPCSPCPQELRAFASTWQERRIVQEVLAQITWYHNIALLERLDDAQTRLWYARKTIANGWSHSILAMQIENAAHERDHHSVGMSEIQERHHAETGPGARVVRYGPALP